MKLENSEFFKEVDIYDDELYRFLIDNLDKEIESIESILKNNFNFDNTEINEDQLYMNLKYELKDYSI